VNIFKKVIDGVQHKMETLQYRNKTLTLPLKDAIIMIRDLLGEESEPYQYIDRLYQVTKDDYHPVKIGFPQVQVIDEGTHFVVSSTMTVDGFPLNLPMRVTKNREVANAIKWAIEDSFIAAFEKAENQRTLI